MNEKELIKRIQRAERLAVKAMRSRDRKRHTTLVMACGGLFFKAVEAFLFDIGVVPEEASLMNFFGLKPDLIAWVLVLNAIGYFLKQVKKEWLTPLIPCFTALASYIIATFYGVYCLGLLKSMSAALYVLFIYGLGQGGLMWLYATGGYSLLHNITKFVHILSEKSRASAEAQALEIDREGEEGEDGEVIGRSTKEV